VTGARSPPSSSRLFSEGPRIEALVHEVRRQPDLGGRRVYAVNARLASGYPVEGVLILGAGGRVVSQELELPMRLEWRRRQ
jgi:hypothetical protein